MQFQTLSYTEKEGILHVKLNRPEKRNAINPQVVMDIQQFFSQVAFESSAQAVLFSGEGKGFCAGTDLTSFQAGDAQKIRKFVRAFQGAFTEIELLEKPVIALIHNFCFGGALEIVLACDLRICTPDTRFSIPEVNMGMVPDGGGSQRLPRVVGLGRAKELILTGKMIDAKKAEQWGLVNEIVSYEDLEKTGVAWARQIMDNGPMGVGLAKRNIDMSMNMSAWDGMECAGLSQTICFNDPDFLKRIEKRFMQQVKNKKS
ncbi:MAG: enoyl-CoA hydratase/isomerase family protein [Dehalococcoidia bacterium]|nr:enoyl-CoA hydratase/isomerase family protein [Dehalococcoidia bacterium]